MSLSSNPWELFELDPEEATLADLKKAYSVKLKEHRPDRDPEGFKIVREAFESAKFQLESPQRFQSFIPEIIFPENIVRERDEMDASASRGQDLPAELQQIEKEIQDMADFDIDRSLELFEKGQAYVKEYPTSLLDWGLISNTLFEGEESYLTKFFRSDDAIWELEHDCSIITMRVIEEFGKQDFYGPTSSFASDLLAVRDRLKTMSAANAYLSLAEDVGFASAEMGEELISAAYEILPPERRQFVIHSATNWVGMGRVFSDDIVAPEMKFWQRRIKAHYRDEEFDWSGEEEQARLQAVLKQSPVSPAFIEVITPMVPESFARTLRGHSSSRIQYERTLQKEKSNPGCWIFFVIFLVFKLVTLSSVTMNRSSNDYSNIDLKPYEEFEGNEQLQALLKAYDERTKKKKPEPIVRDNISPGSAEYLVEIDNQFNAASQDFLKLKVLNGLIQAETFETSSVYIEGVIPQLAEGSQASLYFRPMFDAWASKKGLTEEQKTKVEELKAKFLEEVGKKK